MPRRTVSFARKLQELREAAGISQYELAKRSGLSKQAVSNLELGNREPTWETVQALARGLGVEVGAFVIQQEPPSATPATQSEELEAVKKPNPGRPPKAPPAEDVEAAAKKPTRKT
jgi:transcriptional regulator with XRE-family HTH domain